MRKLLVVTVEGAGPGLFSTYGTQSAMTPALDRLAAQGLVLDQCFADSNRVQTQLQSLWTAEHAASKRFETEKSLWKQLTLGRVDNTLLTDCPRVAELAESFGCENAQLVESGNAHRLELNEPAQEIEDCVAYELFTAAAEAMTSVKSGLVWIHSRGLRLAWDAPTELREQFVDPEDPPPPKDVAIPSFRVSKDTDPDQIVGWAQVATAQAAVIDEGLGLLLEVLSEREDGHEWCIAFVGLGGVPLGEHGCVGWIEPSLYGEEMQCAVVLRPAPALPIGARRPELLQLPDVGCCIAAMSGCGLDGRWGINPLELEAPHAPQLWPRQLKVAIATDANAAWIRTPAWSLLSMNGRTELFLKPDDRWEASNVASRCPDILDQLLDLQDATLDALNKHGRDAIREIDASLCKL